MATAAAVSSLGGFALNPRGNIWLNDDSTLGHKLLKKMGWSKGKGLGKNENGIRENIKVKVKSTNSGVGFKDESFFKVQSTDYDSLLKSISENCEHLGGTAVTKARVDKHGSLEQRSQMFKNRLHYRKFVRGKDLSKYSENDMKSIFILNKTPEENMESPVEGSSALFHKESKSDEKLMNTSNLSISDYFAQKMVQKKYAASKTSMKNLDLPPSAPDSDNVVKENTSLFSTIAFTVKERKSKELDVGNEDSISVNISIEEPATESTLPSKKRKQEDLTFDTPNSINEYQKLNPDGSSLPKKKKKKSKVSEDVCSYVELTNLNANDVVCKKFLTHSKEPNLIPLNSVEITPSYKSSKKLKKSKKFKLKYLQTLKSCLRSKASKYSVKNVTFNENVSCKLFEPVCKSGSEVDGVREQECITLDSDDIIENSSVSSTTTVVEENSANTQCANKETCNKPENNSVKTEEYSLSNLPSCKSDYFNSWIESQRQAMKMKNYKNMLKSLKTHKILRTTNLLSIRGYGNWGY